MFFSVEHLLGRNSNFSVVWRVAHTPDAKVKVFLTRARALGIPIYEVCEALMARIPSGGLMNTEVSSKFSLYLLGELLYGSVRVLERQLFFLNLDAVATCDQIKDILYSGHLFALAQETADEDAANGGKKRMKRKAREPLNLLKDVDLTLPTIQTMDHIDTLIGQAHLASITLQESHPMKQLDMFTHYEEDLIPMTREQQIAMETGMFDFELDAHSREPAPSTVLTSSLKNESGKITDESLEDANVKRKTVADALDPNTLDLLPPRNSLLFDIPLNDLPVDHLDNRAGQAVVDLTDGNIAPQFGDVSTVFNQLTALETPKSPNGMTEIAQAVDAVPPPVALMDDHAKDISLVLEEVGKTPVKRPERKKRNAKVSDSKTQLSYEEMKILHQDYSSLQRPRDDLRIAAIRPSKIALYPQFLNRPFCAELQYLYKPCEVEKMTIEDADRLGIFGDVCRGPENKLWHYLESESGESESKRSKLEEPLDVNMVRPEEFNVDQFDSNHPQGIAFLEATPPRYDKGDVEMFDPVRNLRDDVMDIDHQMMGFNMNERPVSRASEIEDIRRRVTTSLGGLMGADTDTLIAEKTLEGAWGQGTSGMLQSSHMGMTDITQNKDKEDIDYKSEILSSISNGEEIAFSTIVPVKSTSRKQAARAFYCLLELTAEKRVFPTQLNTQEDIYIRGQPY